MNRKTTRLCLTLTLLASQFLLPISSEAFSILGGPKRAPEVFDLERQSLIYSVSHQPELMNVNYLRFVIGSPQNEAQQTRLRDKHYIWYDRTGHVLYELKENHDISGQNVQATMTVHMQGSGVTFDKLDALYQGPSKRFFDNEAQPAEIFSFVPNSSLTFNSAPDSFRVKEARILYVGPNLPPPTAVQMELARAARLARAQNLGDGGPLDAESLALLQSEAAAKPADAQAHFQLAQAYKRNRLMNDALTEYKAAYQLSDADDPLHKQAEAALVAARILTPPDSQQEQVARQDLEFFNHGQRLRQAGDQTDEQQGLTQTGLASGDNRLNRNRGSGSATDHDGVGLAGIGEPF